MFLRKKVIRFRGFGQYEYEYGAPTDVSYIEQAAQAIAAPAPTSLNLTMPSSPYVYPSSQAIVAGTGAPATAPSDGLLGVLRSLLSAGAQVGVAAIQADVAKSAVPGSVVVPAGYMRNAAGQLVPVSSVYPSGVPAGYTVNPVTGQLVSTTSSLSSLGGSLPILAIVGIGAFLLLRGKKKKNGKK